MDSSRYQIEMRIKPFAAWRLKRSEVQNEYQTEMNFCVIFSHGPIEIAGSSINADLHLNEGLGCQCHRELAKTLTPDYGSEERLCYATLRIMDEHSLINMRALAS